MPKLIIVNPGDGSWTRNRYVLWFGAYGTTLMLVWANHLDDALDECIDYIADPKNGLLEHLADDAVHEAYNEAIRNGTSVDEAYEWAEQDTTCGGNCGHYLMSREWGLVVENPTRKELLTITACHGRTNCSR